MLYKFMAINHNWNVYVFWGMYINFCSPSSHTKESQSLRNFVHMGKNACRTSQHWKRCFFIVFILDCLFMRTRGEWGYMKRKVVWCKMKYSCNFWAKTSLKLVSSKNKIDVSFCPSFHTAPFSPTWKLKKFKSSKPWRHKVWTFFARTQPKHCFFTNYVFVFKTFKFSY
jgi:hypothetical protein